MHSLSTVSHWSRLPGCLRGRLLQRPQPARYRAVVSVLLALCPDPRVVMVQRSRRLADPWAGDTAFPGGHLRRGEELLEAGAREVLEEACIAPHEYRVLGFLGPEHPRSRPDMLVLPIVGVLNGCPDARSLAECRSGEVERVFLLSLPVGETGVVEYLHPYRGIVVAGYKDWYGNTVWGMSFRVLKILSRLIADCAAVDP